MSTSITRPLGASSVVSMYSRSLSAPPLNAASSPLLTTFISNAPVDRHFSHPAHAAHRSHPPSDRSQTPTASHRGSAHTTKASPTHPYPACSRRLIPAAEQTLPRAHTKPPDSASPHAWYKNTDSPPSGAHESPASASPPPAASPVSLSPANDPRLPASAYSALPSTAWSPPSPTPSHPLPATGTDQQSPLHGSILSPRSP